MSEWLKKDTFDLSQYGQKVFLDDFSTVGLTAYTMYQLIHDDDFPKAAKVRSALLNYCTDSEPYDLFNQRLLVIFEAMVWCISNLGTHLYWLNYDMFMSFLDAKVFYDSYHNLMIEYRIFDTKAGYFRIDVVDGIVAVRTFLFLTQSGTPEGALLWKNTELQKLDTNYLAIDKLSSFMSSDIGSNAHSQKIFQDSGCQSLLELYERHEAICTKHASQSTCMLMLEYLGYNDAPIQETIFE